jgi:MFS family permease
MIQIVSDATKPSSNGAGDAREITTTEHGLSTMALMVCTLTHSYLLISVFPYSGFMAIDLIPSANEENAGSYAGLIASAFMIGRAITSYGWGKAADIYGRTTVLYASLGFSCLFSLLFGLAPTFGQALFWRFMLGVGNGMMGTAKTGKTVKSLG